MSELLQAALKYAARGHRVFPCGPDKAPLTHHGFKDATVDERQIREWWTLWPDAWIGCPMGGELFVLDIDPRNRGDVTLADWESKNGPLPFTVEATTPSGGWHYYFKKPEGVKLRNGSSVLGPGVDVRCEGGYVIVPPSPGYRWRSERIPVEIPPDSLLRAIQRAATVERTGTEPEQPILQGARNARLTSLAGVMRAKGATQDAIEVALLAQNAGKCLPPLLEGEVRRIATSVSRYEPAQTLTDTNEQVPNVWASARTAEAFLAASDPEADFLEPRLLARGSVTEWFSPRGLGKTFAAHAIAVRLAKAGHRILLVDRDNSPGEVRRRLRGWGAESVGTLKVLTRDEAPPLTDGKAWQTFPVADFDLVVIDSLDSSTEGVGEQDSSKPSKAIGTLLNIARREAGPAVLVLGNVVKSGQHSRGSGVVEDRADVVYEVRDATGLAPSGRRPWYQELAPSGAADWQERASRRGRRDVYHLAFVATKFRIGEEPDPFVLEVNLRGEAWSLRDVTAEVDAAGQQSIAEREREAIGALLRAMEARPETALLAERDGVPILQEAGLTRDSARSLLKREEGHSWLIEEISGRPGKPRVLKSVRGSAEAQNTANPNDCGASGAGISAGPSTQGPPKSDAPEPAPGAPSSCQDISAAAPCGYHCGLQAEPCQACQRSYRDHVWGTR